MNDWIKVAEEVPSDCNDCRVIFKDKTEGIAYFGGGGSKIWCTGIGMPLDKEVIEWITMGNCDSIKKYNTNW